MEPSSGSYGKTMPRRTAHLSEPESLAHPAGWGGSKGGIPVFSGRSIPNIRGGVALGRAAGYATLVGQIIENQSLTVPRSAWTPHRVRFEDSGILGVMKKYPFRKPNHFAVIGFLLPFACVGLTGGLILTVKENCASRGFLIPYLCLVPLILISGLLFSIKSIPLIPDLNDKDYAYAGLTFNLLFLALYIISIIYFLSA